MKRPAFQFYPGDWQRDVALRACCVGARGLWIEMMCLMHQAEPYGHLVLNGAPITAPQIARMVGCSDKEAKRWLQELEQAGVFSRDNGMVFSRRMVRDERLRQIRADGGKDGAEHGVKGADSGAKGGRPRADKNPPSEEFNGLGKPPLNPPPSSSVFSLQSSEETPTPANAGVAAGDAGQPRLQLVGAAAAPAIPDCPHQRIIDLYHEILPLCPRVREWTEARRKTLQTRWREKAEASGKHRGYTTLEDGLAFWRRFFGWVRDSKFLTGQVPGREGRPSFVANLAWLLKPENFAKVVEGNYHHDAA